MDEKEHIRLLEWQVQQQVRVIKKQREIIEHCRQDYNRGSKWHDQFIKVAKERWNLMNELKVVKAELEQLKKGNDSEPTEKLA